MAHFYTSTHVLTVTELRAKPIRICNPEMMFDGDQTESLNNLYRASENFNAVKVCLTLSGDDVREYRAARRPAASRLKLHLYVRLLGVSGAPDRIVGESTLALALPHAAVNYRLHSIVTLGETLEQGSYVVSISLDSSHDDELEERDPQYRFEVLDFPDDLADVFEPYAAGFGELTDNPEDLLRSKPLPVFTSESMSCDDDDDFDPDKLLEEFIQSQIESEEDEDCDGDEGGSDEEPVERDRPDPCDLYAVFQLRLNGWDREEFGMDPEATITYHFANGQRHQERTLVVTRGGGSMPCAVSFAAREDVRRSVPGPVYVELRVFDEPIAGFVGTILTSDLLPERGCFRGKHLAVIERYTPRKGMDWLDKRRIDALYAEDEQAGSRPDSDASTIDELSKMVGLSDVKTKVDSYVKLVRFHKLRADRGISSKLPPLHALFLGAPGTGKTSVAKLMGRLMKEAGMLSKGHVVVRERSQIVGKFYGDETKAMHEALEEADGGVLFIDEAYNLYKEADPKDPGREAIETLLTALADSSRRDWMLILGGYEDRILKMFEMNPGLASRFPQSNRYRFADYTAEELLEIGARFCDENAFELSPEARVKLADTLRLDLLQKDATFGNARHVLNLLETEVFPAMAARVSVLDAPTDRQLRLILPEDVPLHAVRTLRPARLGFAG
ncbi:MAG: AAA family ATPase [Muribaculaceae bacterium]|nr:AAA family ATPase [Muribaculaceae bacterium]